ncbi:MAG: ParB/RepB/Spo0J family partition protein [Lachnospiraceae bacterium]|nr:ParB/RepB/Spo0J family partition protein [Lachnospiraceae bacterium]
MALGKKGGLGSKGRGITALINSEVDNLATVSTSDLVVEIDINKIEPNPNQPRKRFEEGALESLAQSIEECGVIQPIILRKKADYYELIAGERRWRASKIAGLKKIPAIVREMEDETLFEVALIENLQREDLNAIEEANGYKRLSDEFGLNQEDIAKKVAKSRSAVANAIRLLNLDARVQNFVMEGKLSGGHARTLLSLENGDEQFEIAERILEDSLSVRQVESLVKYRIEHKNENKNEKLEKPTKFNVECFDRVETDLKAILGTKVKLKSKQNKGKIEIEFYSDDDLDRLLGLIKKAESFE